MAVFSHELRNSLGAIRGAAGVLRMEISAGPAAMKARAVIERQVNQMTRLVEDLLDVSRVRSGQLRPQRERIDLCAVATEAAQTVGFTMQRRNHRLTTLFPVAPVWVQADPIRLQQLFVNLLVNAAKYTDDGGDVSLSVERNEGEAVVRIRDTGIGIDAELLPHVFDLFVQADPLSRRADAGLGIGLALVRSLVERHGGASLWRAPGSGTEASSLFGCQILRSSLGSVRAVAAPQIADRANRGKSAFSQPPATICVNPPPDALISQRHVTPNSERSGCLRGTAWAWASCSACQVAHSEARRALRSGRSRARHISRVGCASAADSTPTRFGSSAPSARL